MDTASPTIRPGTSQLGWVIAATLAVAATAVLVIAWVITSPTTTTGTPDVVAPAQVDVRDRGAGDPCSLRLESRGGFLEGLGPANRCGDPQGRPRPSGRLP